MPQLNLAAEVFRSQLMARRRRMIYGLAIILLLLVVGAWALPALLTRSREQRIQDVNRKIGTLDAQLQARREEVRPVVLFMRRLEMLKQHLDDHFGWSPILAEFERLTPPVARFTALVGSAETGQLTAQVLVPSVDAAADFIASLQNVRGVNETLFSRVEVKNVAVSEGTGAQGYIVSLRLPVPRSLFRLTLGTTP
ncbi:MAG: hypothetical protein G01um101438_236 [Parcubacteria group bacterium Gr01-1014_38]|nr:MAG: hypothetical protein G01um101438_236 [Parcubacteria group bacterium Gr01-1014_38]